ncbi:MAG: hypothetical protein XU15_C0011G0069 [candidate division NC10 bacterium CSP1-5]|nr:MAG: hypothetical protein XU15_C0011G0069 [candidate division NC10 bacterium CSP1-5]
MNNVSRRNKGKASASLRTHGGRRPGAGPRWKTLGFLKVGDRVRVTVVKVEGTGVLRTEWPTTHTRPILSEYGVIQAEITRTGRENVVKITLDTEPQMVLILEGPVHEERK